MFYCKYIWAIRGQLFRNEIGLLPSVGSRKKPAMETATFLTSSPTLTGYLRRRPPRFATAVHIIFEPSFLKVKLKLTVLYITIFFAADQNKFPVHMLIAVQESCTHFNKLSHFYLLLPFRCKCMARLNSRVFACSRVYFVIHNTNYSTIFKGA